MQSTKEEYHLTRDSFPPQDDETEAAKLLLHQKRLVSQDIYQAAVVGASKLLPMRNSQTGSEKVLVVLLVASATVCFLTNLLVLLILTCSTRRAFNRGRRVKLMLRYQLMRNQALFGLCTATLVIYPLRVLALSFDHQVKRKAWPFFNSETSCFMVFTLPLVSWPLLSLSHSLATYCELILRSLSLQKHSVLSASQKLVTKGLLFMAAWPFGLAAFSLAPQMTNFQQICYRPWTMTYWAILMALLALLTLMLSLAFGLHWITKAKSPNCKDPSADTTSLISANSFHSARYAGCQQLNKKAASTAASSGSPTSSTTAFMMMVHTVDPPPFLDLSLPTASLLNFVMNVLLYIPCLVHLRPLPMTSKAAEVAEAANDAFLLWMYVLILIGGSVTPVIHLMTDEALSSLGLDIVRKNACLTLSGKTKHKNEQGQTNEACNNDSL